MKRIQICDTTLRDGCQAEGISFSLAGKLRLAEELDRFGIDYIEGGYAVSNPKDMAFFRRVRRRPLTRAKVTAFGSTRRKATRVAEDANVMQLLAAETDVVTIFGKAWSLHVSDVLRTTAAENRKMIGETVRYLKEKGKEVIFDAEHFFDGYKDSPAFAMSALKAAIEAGADLVVLCDTNGGSLPKEVYDMTRAVRRAAPVPVGIHTHNDSELAVANTVEAVRAGAVHVQGTVNGYGERCGNCNLCSAIPVLQIKMGLACCKPGSLTELRNLALCVEELANVRHGKKAAFVGESAFAHKGGMHVDAIKKNPRSFEHIEPEAVGNQRRVLISEWSGSSNVLLKALDLGVRGLNKSSPKVRRILEELKKFEGKGYAYEAAEASFEILIQKVLKKHKPFFDLKQFKVFVEKRGKNRRCVSEATIKVRVNGEEAHTVGEGDGPVNALDNALRKALIRFYPEIADVRLTDFRVSILDPEEATAATTRVLVESTDGEDTWGTVGVSENIIEASWEALLDSVEYKLFREEGKRRGKRKGGDSHAPADRAARGPKTGAR
ncbi:MAG: citramalate synthase [Kiritimatiellae bacterium]|nr:citramalate synthase [Kiritimatiellia bacterium]